ncbi:Fanconi anemia group D2 protein-like [Biomphalaria glabrata]|uniref:Fanconi anemia group D2 protein-like n=3 Tax=Biomphalaria glabrata TaxID=6526 RepID=A0A9W3A7D3_BIOGL|nr:Fanconi anemia group D2 protein-like [Biomphalaria glabrata]XP_055883252.1 Fanconi anemia group D2 protein-like [Biomphalaria glabrata]XP_055883253.1 Fanconi anemia group D2 protein-like [Biomphalaria glabrata]
MTSLSRKRSQPKDVASGKKSKTDTDFYDKQNLLCKLSTEAGLILKNGSQDNEISVPKVLFQKQLGTALKNYSENLLETVQTFTSNFEEYIDDTKRFHKSLMSCVLTLDGKSSQTDSVVRIFLGVDVIQSTLMSLLLDKLPEFMGDHDDYIFDNGQKVYVPRLLLSQYRFLDRIVDGQTLSQKLLDILSVCSLDVQKEIMACIPDIVDDSQHEQVARKLRDELLGNKDLTCPVIEALTYLNIMPDLVAEIRTSVLDILKSFSIPDLPVVIKFLLESVTAQDAAEVVNEIRSSIDFTTSSKLSSEKLARIKTGVKLTIEALKDKIQFKRFITEAWIKVLDAAKDTKPLDLFILLILSWLKNNKDRKSVESLFRNRIRSGNITQVGLEKAFSHHTEVLREYFPSIMSLASVFQRSPEPSICFIGCCMYKLAFSFFDSYCKQEVVKNLISHIGSGFAGEIEASLDILAELIQDQLPEMARFATFLKRVLDYLDHNNLSVVQIKKLYLMLAKLAFTSSQDGSYLQDDLHIIICKQLTSINPKYKRMGVMGALSIIHALAFSAESAGGAMGDNEYSEVVQLLELVQNNSNKDPETRALFLDGLAAVMATEKVYNKVMLWVANNMTQVFEENYIADTEEDAELTSRTSVPVDVMYGLNNEAESTVVLNLVPLLEQQLDDERLKRNNSSKSLLCLSPLFHLVTVCELKTSDNNLDNIDALLGCPVLMVKPEVCEEVKTMSAKEKDIVCSAIFYCINWFREVINSFAPMSNPEMKAKVIMRLKHVTELVLQLETCLSHHNNFQPPLAIFDEVASPVVVPSTAAPSTSTAGSKKKGRKNTKKGKKCPTEDVSNANDTTFTDILDKSQDTTLLAKTKKSIDMSAYRPFFRELNFKVFAILQAGVITRAALDSEMNTKTTEELQIGLPELVFLLEDLSLKLNHSLIATATKRRSFLHRSSAKNVGFAMLDQHTPKEIAEEMAKLLPCLCDHLEETYTFFKTQISNNDGLLDAPNRWSAKSVNMADCFHLLIQCIHCLFSWSGFQSESNKSLLEKCLKVMVKRISSSQNKNSFVSLQDSFGIVFQYFGVMVEACPGLETGATLIKLLMLLADKCQRDDVNDKLVSLAKMLLSRDWVGPDGQRLKGAKHNENLQVVIKCFIEYSDQSLEALEVLSVSGLAEMIRLEKDECLEEFGSLHRHSFPVYYKVILSELINIVKKIPAGRKTDSSTVQDDRLASWSTAVKVLQVATSLTKVFSARSNLAAALKYGRQFLECFLRQSMPLLDVIFRRRHTDVEKLLRTLQQSTRMLQHLCGHSKNVKDMSLTNQVPTLKRALETLIFRVKAMLILNNCQDAFWVGNLKNRNLKGDEISTQETVKDKVAPSGDGDGNEEEKDPDEAEEGDEDIGDVSDESEVEVSQEEEGDNQTTSTTSAGGSYSEIF